MNSLANSRGADETSIGADSSGIERRQTIRKVELVKEGRKGCRGSRCFYCLSEWVVRDFGVALVLEVA